MNSSLKNRQWDFSSVYENLHLQAAEDVMNGKEKDRKVKGIWMWLRDFLLSAAAAVVGGQHHFQII